jgi:hypothetical protein
MGLGKTLLKVAIGVAVVKGISALTKGGAAAPEPERKPGRGTQFDPKGAGPTGGLEDMLKDVLGSGGRSRSGRTSGGGLGDLLDQMSGQKRSSPRASAPKGGLEDLWGQVTGRAARPEAGGRASGGVGDLLDQVLADRPGGRGGPISLPEPEVEEELSAALMLRAVIQAVKCDGELDDEERERLVQAMGDASQREVQGGTGRAAAAGGCVGAGAGGPGGAGAAGLYGVPDGDPVGSEGRGGVSAPVGGRAGPVAGPGERDP